ncbi:O-fucosyltransferase 36 [Turnera subulata]|uniref:GDP-fucose protein O-fucosyltransferase 2 n=1 Tax=Turnera subulata TaxID=218843 RepID=A0A9Q0G6G2_9ROSI|nr:O-fucosyltransferase 36 [Turnera subulata]
MERDSSSEDEDDREHLIEQHDRKHDDHLNLNHNNHHHHHQPLSSSPRRRYSFDIEELQSRIRRRVAFNFNKRYLFAILSLPIFIILLYFATDIRDMFPANLRLPGRRPVSLPDRMRESELRALYLLRQQQLSLFSLYNQSLASLIPNPNSTTLQNSNKTNALDPTFKIQDLISLNKRIQQVLLSAHQSGNVSSDADFDGVDNAGLLGRCKKVDQRLSERRTIEWKPRSNKFLFAVCLSGQMSNHLICLEKHMFFAALLNRVLVIPSPKFDYVYSRVLDIDHINDCLGKKAVVSYEQFVETKKNKPHIDRFICYFSSPTPCYVDEEHIKKLKGLGISMGGKPESPWKEDVRKPSKRTVQDVQAKFGSDEDVIAIGDVFFADLEQDWVMQPGGPLAHKCNTLIEPTKLIMVTAQRFIQTFLGNNFIALHFRRHGFLKFCNAKTPSCFYPIPQAADCIARVVERANAPVIYLSTDAAESETGLLQSLVVVNGKTVPLVKRPPYTSVEKWDSLLVRHGIHDDPQVEAMLDKTICAMSNVFIGASGSTFTEDILRLRRGWGSASLCDEYLCDGELPNFIAENE